MREEDSSAGFFKIEEKSKGRLFREDYRITGIFLY